MCALLCKMSILLAYLCEDNLVLDCFKKIYAETTFYHVDCFRRIYVESLYTGVPT